MASPVTRDTAWTAFLLGLWLVAALACAAQTIDRTGAGGRPWFGWWDAIVVGSSEPFVVTFVQPHAAGAAASAGIRDSDRADLREENLDTRTRVMWQLSATEATLLKLHRSTGIFATRATGSTLWDGGSARRVTHFLDLAPTVTFLACALLIILRRSRTFEGRALALFLLCLVIAQVTRPASFAVPNGTFYILIALSSGIFSFAAMVILIRLSSKFGTPTAWRRVVESIAYITSTIFFAGTAAGCIGLWTMWFDPLPFVMGGFWRNFGVIAAVIVGIAAVSAVASSARAERPRAGWLLLPLPLALALNALFKETVGAQSWAEVFGIVFTAGALSLGSAMLVTYALLKRRVLDAGFILSRSVVVAIVSLIVVAAFILLEWLLGSVVTNVSHATGVIANAALALILGLSMRLLHKRVDTFVDAVMFRKRRENTRALSDFAKEAAFVTDCDALVSLAIDIMRKHTDARSAGIFFSQDGKYKAIRSFNGVPELVSENDPAILALKTWHKPLDPHRYSTALKGDLALPMVARGQLVGLVLCGEREGSEAYAPDEIDALAQFAQGIGSAYDGVANDGAVLRELRRLREIVERRLSAEQH